MRVIQGKSNADYQRRTDALVQGIILLLYKNKKVNRSKCFEVTCPDRHRPTDRQNPNALPSNSYPVARVPTTSLTESSGNLNSMACQHKKSCAISYPL